MQSSDLDLSVTPSMRGSFLGVSTISESKIVSAFKRFVDEKRKSLTQIQTVNPNGILPSNLKQLSSSPNPNDESLTYQSQIISAYYSLDDQDQINFWNNVSLDGSNIDPDEFYFMILKKISDTFGINRESNQLDRFLLDKVIYAYNSCGDRIYITEILRFDDKQHVGLGFMSKSSPSICNGEENLWIVKWNVDPAIGEYLTSQEFNKWSMIENVGAEIPKVLSGFYILDFPVIVMENLDQLETTDYNQKLLMSIISFIEKIVPIGVLNNITPSNILKRVSKDGNTTYLIADVIMMATEERQYGFARFNWSTYWSSQVVDIDTVTTVKNDLTELGYTLIYLSNPDPTEDLISNIRIVERTLEIQEWMSKVNSINEQDIKLYDFVDLKKIAQKFPKMEIQEKNFCS
jgi:hypothetical protein